MVLLALISANLPILLMTLGSQFYSTVKEGKKDLSYKQKTLQIFKVCLWVWKLKKKKKQSKNGTRWVSYNTCLGTIVLESKKKFRLMHFW